MIEKKSKFQTGNMSGAVKNDGTEVGQIQIHENVIATIVRRTACGVKGVKRISGSHFVDNLADLIGSRRLGDRAINVKIERERVDIQVKLNLQYGAHIPTVASNVQSAVSSEIERLTGLTVRNVTVIIQELEDTENAEKTEEK